MEFSAASAHRGLIPWLGLLLAEPVSVPILVASNTTVTENEDAVVMTCYSSVKFTDWLFNGTSLQFNERMKLSKGQESLTIDPVKREDAGNYQCKVSNPITSFESEPVELDVKETCGGCLDTCDDGNSQENTYHLCGCLAEGREPSEEASALIQVSEGGTEQAEVTMEFPVASAHRGLIPWLGLLLAVFPSSLPIWIPPTTAQIAVVSTIVAEGQDVILRIRSSPPGVLGYWWYRGTEMKYSDIIGYFALSFGAYIRGPANSGRETIKADGSLTISKVTQSDQGFYMVQALLPNSQTPTGSGWFAVYQPVSVPTLLASNTTVTENEDAVVMTCYTDARSTYWLFNGMSLSFSERMKLSQDHRTLTIDPVRREDAGNYQCKVYNPISTTESAPVELHVKY
ncbi:hypothetical protein QTO34_010314 [Cnephaeus nilssonii]|uniref:Ig-like domain-containing protein n=1 Tax=Cnephaeus nilssonii TaxID=3371016 RepID=A0AA40HFD2_CNENI|nr:hypothetical protein QTO34_010314 [Eptesicus nilssonii]